ncbi:WD repeat-containing protein 81-like isoform X2 [Ciona intestinalis]
MEENLIDKLSQELKVPRAYFKVLDEKSAIALVDADWIEAFKDEDQVVESSISDVISEQETEELFRLSSRCEDKGTFKISISVVDLDSAEHLKLFLSKSKYHSLGKLCGDIAKQNYRNQLLISHQRFPHNYFPASSESVNDELCEIHLELLSHSNLLMPYGIVKGCANSYIIRPFLGHSVRHALMYSPNMLSQSNSKPLFLVYQILQLFKFLHRSCPSLDLCGLSWGDIALNELMWLRARICHSIPQDSTKNLQVKASEQQEISDTVTPKDFDETIANTVDKWVCGKMNNFDYLMYLNKLTGRRSKDPHHHPILPWISDLSSFNGGWRDLSKSKYRLNKGDDQLYLQYAMAEDNSCHGAQVPHHVPDMLSDITYYVYMARRISRDVLQKHVRSYWEPNEYPSTIQRIQEWSPDECIPEFFTDPTVFYSVHPDMSNLGLPDWAESPEDFVLQHMEMLESPQVSAKLHEWIDVTFGYKLSGKHAVQSMNVCRQLVDHHTDPHTQGIVQLFTTPHPQRRMCCGDEALILNPDQLDGGFLSPGVETAKDALVVQETGELKSGDDIIINDEIYKSPKISLPVDYEPFKWLDQLEKLLLFKSRDTEKSSLSTTFCEVLQNDNDLKTMCSLEDLTSDKNMLLFICLVLELYLAPQLHAKVERLPLSKRFEVITACYSSYKAELPSGIRYPVDYMLKNLAAGIEGTCAQLMQWESTAGLDCKQRQRLFKSTTNRGFPPPIPGHLLHTSMHIMHFPIYFDKLYTFLEYLLVTTDHYTTPLLESSFPEVNVSLNELLHQLHGRHEGLEILLPHVLKLLQQPPPHSINFLMLAFDSIAQELGPKESCKVLLPVVVNVYKTVSSHQDKLSTLIYTKPFITQLYHRFGLQVFMDTFPCLMIEKLGKSSFDSETIISSLQWIIMKFGPTLTSKYVVRHVLRVLNTCFYNSTDGEVPKERFQPLINCLIFSASMYGPSYFTLQYIPYLSHTVSSAIRGTKFTGRACAALEATTTILTHLVPYLTDKILMEQLSRLSKEIILPLIGMLAAKNCSFPLGGPQRRRLCLKTVKLILAIGVRIGREMARLHLNEILQSFFKNYELSISNGLSRNNTHCDDQVEDLVFTIPSSLEPASDSISAMIRSSGLNDSWLSESPNSLHASSESLNMTSSSTKEKTSTSLQNRELEEKILAEISETFCPETAYHAYVPFTRLMGGIHMEGILKPNHELIWKLSSNYGDGLEEACGPNNKVSSSSKLSSSANITMVGNRIVLDEHTEPNDYSTDGITVQRKDLNGNENSHLTGNWLAYWEHEIGLPDTDNQIHFNQINLQNFTGHNGAIRCMCVNNSEEWFATGGKDKAVKIWSLQNTTSDYIKPSYVYTSHKKSPSHISILESDNTMLTCDGSVHVWDPYTGQTITTFDSSDFKSGIVCLESLPAPNRTTLAANSDSIIKVVDVRAQSLAQEYKTNMGPSVGVIRTMCATSTWVAVGFSSGVISIIDIRMGPILRMWQAHDSDITTSCLISPTNFLTASMDQTVAHWETTSTTPRMVYRSITEPVTTVRTYHTEIVSSSSSNRINIHRLLNTDFQNGKGGLDKPTTVTKLRSETLKGTLSTFRILPMKRQLLVSSDSGAISLLA